MSTLKATYLQHPSASSANVTLASDGKATFNGAMVGAGLDLITTSTFSTVSSVSINNCFSSTYENYRIIVTGTNTVENLILMRLRGSSTDAAGSDYGTQSVNINSTTVSVDAVTSQTNLRGGVFSTAFGGFTLDIYSPQLAQPTSFFAQSVNFVSGGTPRFLSYTSRHGLSTAYDGFSLIPASGTMTGTLRVYGYRNS